MHRLATSFILGYHGCSRKVGERLLEGELFLPSNNEYDWLGGGVYFWESNPRRGLEFAKEAALRRTAPLDDAFVVGAIIELGLGCDLTTAAGIDLVKSAYQGLAEELPTSGRGLPVNSPDGLRRNLDCAVITWLHEFLDERRQPPIDTLRGIFIEGEPIYPGAGFYAKTHVQIVVRNPACIKGVYRIPKTVPATL